VANRPSVGPGAGRYDRVASSASHKAVATWEEADPDTVWRTICEVTEAGDALTFSRTRDGGAVTLTVLSGDQRVRQYATGAEEIAELLQLVREAAQPD
jgi:hypothetical protein